MKNSDMFKRYGMFIAGVIFSALGISLITKAGLGTSPITSLAFVLTFIFPHTLGTFTMMVNSVMFIIQVILLGKAFQKSSCSSFRRHFYFPSALTAGSASSVIGRQEVMWDRC